MQNNNHSIGSSLIKYCNIQDKNQYLLFRPIVSTKMLQLLKQQSNQQSQSQLNKLYSQISGTNCDEYSCWIKNQNNILQLIKNITVFGGQILYGEKFMDSFNQISILKLKLTQIQHISFQNLKQLIFNDCKINNIEVLSFIDIKHVNRIWLNNNNIVSLQPFSKTSFSDLKHFNIQFNNCSYHLLSQFQRSHSPDLKEVFIGRQRSEGIITNYLKDFRMLAKLQIDPKRWEKQQKVIIVCEQIRQLIKWRDTFSKERMVYVEY